MDATGVAEQPLAVPVRVHSPESLNQTVVLAEEHGVEGGQAWLLGSTAITWEDKEY